MSLLGFVIMPEHFHLLIIPSNGVKISKKTLDNFIWGWYRNKILEKINFVVLPFHKFS
jgi:hypothetical protein